MCYIWHANTKFQKESFDQYATYMITPDESKRHGEKDDSMEIQRKKMKKLSRNFQLEVSGMIEGIIAEKDSEIERLKECLKESLATAESMDKVKCIECDGSINIPLLCSKNCVM